MSSGLSGEEEPSKLYAGIFSAIGRAPQDELEAAVVLEAFGGFSSEEALAHGVAVHRFGQEAGRGAVPGVVPGLAHGQAPERAPDTTPVRPWTGIDVRSVISDVAFLISVLSVGFWLSRHNETFGEAAINRSWRLALPISLASQWFLRRRAITGPEGLGRLRREWALVVPAAAALVGLALVPDGGPLAALLACLWVCGFLVARRGWGAPYCAVIVAVLVETSWPVRWIGRGALSMLLGLVLGTAALAVFALRTSIPSQRLPGSLARSLLSGLIGGCMGLFLVAEPQFAWGASSAVSAFTIVPSLIASLLGGLWMTQLWRRVPLDLRSVQVGGPAPQRVWSGVALFAEALAIVVIAATVLSLVVLWVSDDQTDITRTLLFAHAALAAAGLSVAVLEALGRWGRALTATVAGVVAAFALPDIERVFGLSSPPAGARILFGGLVAVAIGAPAVFELLGAPARRIVAST